MKEKRGKQLNRHETKRKEKGLNQKEKGNNKS